MYPRYFVTSRILSGGSAVESTFAFGRFKNQAEAEEAAKKRYDQYGLSEVVEVRVESRVEATIYKIERFFIRSIRIAVGGAIAFLDYVFLWNSDDVIGNVPFGSLTLNMILRAFFHGILLVGLVCLAWFIAFGSGSDDEL